MTMETPDHTTLCDLPRALGPRAAVLFPHTGEQLTANGLDEASARFAHRLLSAGVRPGEVVGLLTPTAPEVFVGLFGIVRAGAAVSMLPSSPGPPEHEAQRLAPTVDAARMRHLVVHTACAETAHALRELRPNLRLVPADRTRTDDTGGPAGLAGPAPADRLPAVAPEDLAVVQFTSGSTSAPKGVVLSHSTVLAGLRAIVESAGMTSRDALVSWVPHFHDMGLFGPLAVLLAGGPAHVVPPLEFLRRPAGVLRLLSETRATLLTGPDFSYLRLAAVATEQALEGLDLSHMRLAFNGAEPVQAATMDALSARLAPAGFSATAAYPVYGMAEATLAVAFPRPGSRPRVVHLDRGHLADHGLAVVVPPGHPQAKALVSVGRPVQGMRLRLVDTEGAECEPGRLGEIQIAGPAVTSGYYGAPAATAEAFDGPWLRTGDLGLQLGGDLFVTGRHKEMIIVNGRNHFPEDAENIAREQPGVHRRNCVAYADETHNRLTVAVEVTPGGDPEAVAARIHRVLTDRLGLAAVQVHPLPPGTLPRTTSGKWQRGLVRKLLAGQPAAR
ncbi:AMP-binding protein [Streptomyces sp. NPDC050504]|uniref:AMP-binding protein n=1 Tax=Streptomyces sp. NPDC050504 TaxID=3365618 RepID=UPI00378F3164